MPELVPIPWQPSFYLTPDTLALLEAASSRAGHPIMVDDAWRSYAQQKRYWDAYQAYLRGGPWAAIASNPDTGQRNHMRAGAVDIVNRADRAAMLAAGFTPDGDEWWHFNNPRWASMPIIPTNTNTAAAGGTTPLEDHMSAAEVADIKAHMTAEVNRLADYVRRESRPARLYKREDGTLWIAGPTVVPRPVRADTPTEHDLDILRGDTLMLGAGDVAAPQKISDAAWSVLVREHEAFRDYLRS